MKNGQFCGEDIETGVEKWTRCLQVLLCQISEGTRLRVVTEDGGVHVFEHKSLTEEMEAFKLGSTNHAMKEFLRGSVVVVESTNSHFVENKGWFAGGVRLGEPMRFNSAFWCRRDFSASVFPPIKSIEGINIREDNVTGETVRVLEKYFAKEQKDSQATYTEIRGRLGEMMRSIFDKGLSRMGTDCGDSFALVRKESVCNVLGTCPDPVRLQQAVSVAIDGFCRETCSGKVRFGRKQLLEIGRAFEEFVINYGVNTDHGMVASTVVTFETGHFLGKKTPFRMYVLRSPYDGSVIKFSLSKVLPVS